MYVDGLNHDGRLHGDSDVADGAHLDGHVGNGIGESLRFDGDAVGSGGKIVHAEVSMSVAGGGALNGGVTQMDSDGCGRNVCAAAILHQAAQRAAKGLRSGYGCSETNSQ